MSTAKVNKAQVTAAPALTVDWLRSISVVLAIVGIFVAGYMAWAELTGNETVCTDAGKIDCGAVQTSVYAKTLGFPVAIQGTLGYIAILAVLLLEDQLAIIAANGRSLIVGMTLYGTIFQMYLTWIEASVLDAFCQWCIASSVIIAVLLVIGIYRFFEFLRPLQR
ncbi:MAG: vitamin K epoxide reductase family protein [Anaerolineae bacterium]|nr:vitamin K epoxide reductase family protein [Anaerolineae bacterium]